MFYSPKMARLSWMAIGPSSKGCATHEPDCCTQHPGLTACSDLCTKASQVHPLHLQVVLMSATLDSDMFASYFGGAVSLKAGGRTFPVEHHLLEDAYEMLGYRLAADSPAALRSGRNNSRQRLEKAAGNRDKQKLRIDDNGRKGSGQAPAKSLAKSLRSRWVAKRKAMAAGKWSAAEDRHV